MTPPIVVIDMDRLRPGVFAKVQEVVSVDEGRRHHRTAQLSELHLSTALYYISTIWPTIETIISNIISVIVIEAKWGISGGSFI